MNNTTLSRQDQAQLEELVAARTGARLSERDLAKLQRTVAERMLRRNFNEFGPYFDLLRGGCEAGQNEWRQLIPEVTTPESYFFRDQGQFSLLRSHLLKELIERNRAGRTLWVWSAGCSTGEEPYSVAMLLEELLPRHAGWQVQLLGTDLNEESLDKARRGLYSGWSFRSWDSEEHGRYFSKCDEGWQLQPRIREKVEFQNLNLITDDYPRQAGKPVRFDLILCRNVFIYFEPRAVELVLNRLKASLKASGYLITGQAELAGVRTPGLLPRFFPESIVYQRAPPEPSAARHGLAKPASQLQTISPQSATALAPGLGPVEAIPRISPVEAQQTIRERTARGHIGRTIDQLTCLGHCEPASSAAWASLAEAHADAGRYPEAKHCACQALQRDPFLARAHYLLAHVAELEGDHAEAKSLFKKLIYIAPDYVAAYAELSFLYGREHDAARASKMREAALTLLTRRPLDAVVDPYRTITAADLAASLGRLRTEAGAKPTEGRFEKYRCSG